MPAAKDAAGTDDVSLDGEATSGGGQGFNPRASKMSKSGIEYTPVDSIATVVTPHAPTSRLPLQILRETIEYLSGLRIPVRWRGHERFTGAHVEALGRSVCRANPLKPAVNHWSLSSRSESKRPPTCRSTRDAHVHRLPPPDVGARVRGSAVGAAPLDIEIRGWICVQLSLQPSPECVAARSPPLKFHFVMALR